LVLAGVAIGCILWCCLLIHDAIEVEKQKEDIDGTLDSPPLITFRTPTTIKSE